MHLTDSYNRQIDYLRISVTDRCNLRCVYCMPVSGIVPNAQEEILTFEEIQKVAKAAVELGVNKIRITGGEPLVRKGIDDLVGGLANIAGLADLSMTTNGIFLTEYLTSLEQAGLQRINISLDTLNENKYKFITRVGRLDKVIEGIKKARATNLLVKINVVIIKGINDDEILDFVKFSCDNEICVRFIEFMPINRHLFWQPEKFLSIAEVKSYCEKKINLEKCEVSGNGPAEYYQVTGTPGKIGFIGPLSNRFCAQCNRLRLSSIGQLKGCLGNGQEIDLREKLRENAPLSQISGLIKKSVLNKPQGHCMNLIGDNNLYQTMSQIGG